jgi:hypothetical protein
VTAPNLDIAERRFVVDLLTEALKAREGRPLHASGYESARLLAIRTFERLALRKVLEALDV